MDLVFKYFLLGALEGLTEFLPISSTAHLILFSRLVHLPQTSFHSFIEIFIQIGAILAIIFSYFKIALKQKTLLLKIFISFLPTAFIAVLSYKIIKNTFFNSELLISLALISVGILFIFIELLISKQKLILNKSLNDLTYLESFLIGLFQSLSIIPGVSRAGAVILGMMMLGYKRKEAVLYSFLLGIPTIISAGFYDLYKTKPVNLINDLQMFLNLAISFFASFIFALVASKWFLKYLETKNLLIFGYYRIILGLVILVLILFV